MKDVGDEALRAHLTRDVAHHKLDAAYYSCDAPSFEEAPRLRLLPSLHKASTDAPAAQTGVSNSRGRHAHLQFLDSD
jgi:hypothetical protein